MGKIDSSKRDQQVDNEIIVEEVQDERENISTFNNSAKDLSLSRISILSIGSMDIVAQRICQVIIPVIICSLYSSILIRIFEKNSFETTNLLSRAWLKLGLKPLEDGSTTFSQLLLSNFIIVSIFIILIILITLIVLFIFYLEWHNCLNYYFYLPSLVIMTLVTPIFIRQILLALNYFSLDQISLVLFMWNFTILGMISIFNIYTKAPLCIKQFYLINNSSLLAVLIIFILPNWAAWLLLIFLVIWDLFAVLSPYGPLNLIINMADREGIVEMPGLIYTTDVEQSNRLKSNDSISKDKIENNKEEEEEKEEGIKEVKLLNKSIQLEDLDNNNSLKSISNKIDNSSINEITSDIKQNNGIIKSNEIIKSESSIKRGMQERGVNIGLGDFIFYSLLVGLTCKGKDVSDFYSTISCLLTIVVGLILTLIILAYTKRALPALPISISFGIIMATITKYSVPQLSNRFSVEQVFV